MIIKTFDYKNLLLKHSKVLSAEEIDPKELPERMRHKSKISRYFLIYFQIDKATYELVISEPDDFPKTLPCIHLAHPEMHDFHNHVNFVGNICYLDEGAGVFIDVKKPEAVLHKVLSMTGDTIESSFDRNLTSLYEEFEGYWNSLPDIVEVGCFYTPGSTPESIKAFCDPKSKKKFVPLILYKNAIPKEYGYYKRLQRLQSMNAWYIPLSKSVLPPLPDSGLNVFYVRKLLNYINTDLKRKLLSILTKQKKKRKGKKEYRNEIYLFSHPRPSGKLALFGVFASGYSNKDFFSDSYEQSWKLLPLSIQRHYRSYMLERGGSSLNMKDITVAVIGCGAVGSRISEFLALSGVGHIMIIDYDILKEDNIYRHVLGGESIDINKAKAMADYLKRRFPYIDVYNEPANRESWMKGKKWKDIQLIIDATADFTGMREMNKTIFALNNPVPTVYCWLEACSIGGHAILVDGKSKGCFECLLDSKENGPYRRCDFLKPYQKITKDLTGCGGAFTPFSSLDAIKTATLAVELAIENIMNKQKSIYKYWIGESRHSENAGLVLSDWYKKAYDGNTDNVETNYYKINCPICSCNL